MNPLRQTNRRGTLLAFPIQTPSSHDALLVVDLSNPSYRSLGRFIRTGSTLVAAPELHPGAGCHYRHHRLAQVKGTQRPVGPSSPHRPFAVSPFRFWPSSFHLSPSPPHPAFDDCSFRRSRISVSSFSSADGPGGGGASAAFLNRLTCLMTTNKTRAMIKNSITVLRNTP
jgi:hypothetical protein